MNYLSFADKAEKEGFQNAARLFTAIAFAEKVHATNHHRVMYRNDPTTKNLETAISGEDYVVKSMYPDFFKEAVKSGKDAEVGVVYVCEVCGHTFEDHAPDTRPVCGAKNEKFRKF